MTDGPGGFHNSTVTFCMARFLLRDDCRRRPTPFRRACVFSPVSYTWTTNETIWPTRPMPQDGRRLPQEQRPRKPTAASKSSVNLRWSLTGEISRGEPGLDHNIVCVGNGRLSGH